MPPLPTILIINNNIAVEKVKTSVEDFYSFILMDIQMPRLNGYDATKQIRSLNNKRLAAIPIEINKLRKELFKCM